MNNLFWHSVAYAIKWRRYVLAAAMLLVALGSRIVLPHLGYQILILALFVATDIALVRVLVRPGTLSLPKVYLKGLFILPCYLSLTAYGTMQSPRAAAIAVGVSVVLVALSAFKYGSTKAWSDREVAAQKAELKTEQMTARAGLN